MRPLIATNWPVSYMEQSLFIQKIEDELERVEAAQRSVVLHQATPPTRKEWEQAYVNQTGRALPITPGSRLIWRDYASGRAKMYTTAYDLTDGSQSSGAVYEWSSSKRERGPYRFLGTGSGLGVLHNAQERAVYEGASSSSSSRLGNLILKPSVQMQQRLRTIEIYFNLQITAGLTSKLDFTVGQTFAYSDKEGINPTHSMFDESIAPGPVYTKTAYTISLNDFIGRLTNADQAAQVSAQRLFGRLVLTGISDLSTDEGNADLSNFQNFSYAWQCYSFPSTGSAAHRFSHGMGACRNQYPVSDGLAIYMYNSGTATYPQTPNSRIWAYGWYDTDYTVDISPFRGFHDIS